MLDKLKSGAIQFWRAVGRYPLTIAFLFLAFINYTIIIQSNSSGPTTLFMTFLIGAAISAVGQQVYERFFSGKQVQFIIYLISIGLTFTYYLLVHLPELASWELEVKTSVLVFALLLAFTWIPTIKNKRVQFHDAFLVAFRAFFTAILFTLVMILGLSAILLATDQLLFSVHYTVYEHVYSTLLILFSPLFFLSLIPQYPQDDALVGEEKEERLLKALEMPKLLMILLSYVIIPLIMIYTVILIIYISMNISGTFWQNDLLESMLISYSILTVFMMILVARIDHPLANFYRKVMPKVLIPIVLLQIIASVLKIGEVGLTHGRYYVILYGVFAILAGILLSIWSVKKNGWIAILLISFSVISILPPVDAFTVSKANHVHLLKTTLDENGMLQNGEIVPNSSVNEEDKIVITRTVRYLERMGYVMEVDWLPQQLVSFDGFQKVFGFNAVYGSEEDGGYDEGKFFSLKNEPNIVLDTTESDRLIPLFISYHQQQEDNVAIPFEVAGEQYELDVENQENGVHLFIRDNQENVLIESELAHIVDQLKSYSQQELALNDATFVQENEHITMQIVVRSFSVYDSSYDGDLYILVKMK